MGNENVTDTRFHEDTPPIAVPISQTKDKPYRILTVRGKPSPPVVIVEEDGSRRAPLPAEVTFEELTDG